MNHYLNVPEDFCVPLLPLELCCAKDSAKLGHAPWCLDPTRIWLAPVVGQDVDIHIPCLCLSHP